MLSLLSLSNGPHRPTVAVPANLLSVGAGRKEEDACWLIQVYKTLYAYFNNALVSPYQGNQPFSQQFAKKTRASLGACVALQDLGIQNAETGQECLA